MLHTCAGAYSVCVSLFFYRDNRHLSLPLRQRNQEMLRWGGEERMDRVQRWSRGSWTTAEIRNSIERVRGFFSRHNPYSPHSHHRISLPLIGEAKVLFGKADFFFITWQTFLCVMFSFSDSLGEPLGRGDLLTSGRREHSLYSWIRWIHQVVRIHVHVFLYQ